MRKFKYVLGTVILLVLIAITVVYFYSKNKNNISTQKVTKSKELLVKKENDDTIKKFATTQLCKLNWNTTNGVPYVKVPGANLGVTSFYVLDNEKIAFLSDATNEILIVSQKSESVIKRFTVVLSPRDFTYDNGYYYVLCETGIFIYNINGENTSNFEFPKEYSGTMRIFRYLHSTFLLLPSGNSLKIESGGKLIKPKEYEGWITSNGLLIKTQIKNEFNYTVNISFPNGENSLKEFPNKRKIAGVYVVGTEKNRIVLEIQTFLTEEPIKVERNIQIIGLRDFHLDKIIATIPITSSFYVLSNKDIYVTNEGRIYTLVTKSKGVYLFSIDEYK